MSQVEVSMVELVKTNTLYILHNKYTLIWRMFTTLTSGHCVGWVIYQQKFESSYFSTKKKISKQDIH